MTESETADVVRRIVSTWPMSPKGFVWTEALGDLDYGPCLAAFSQLRDEHDESRLSVARFKMAVRSVQGGTSARTVRRHPLDPDEHEGPFISLGEYLARQTWGVGTGDPRAAENLAVWDQAQKVIDKLGALA